MMSIFSSLHLRIDRLTVLEVATRSQPLREAAQKWMLDLA
jgi:hypothetical protein